MMFTVELAVKSRLELFESWKWYEQQQEGLGEKFEAEAFEKINTIIENPLLYPLKGNYRQAPLDNFPFLVIYQVKERQSTVLVLSIFHTSRHPRKKY